jgi:uncharacterized membrane-anchored protein YhcB (DUF1043 family)
VLQALWHQWRTVQSALASQEQRLASQLEVAAQASAALEATTNDLKQQTEVRDNPMHRCTHTHTLALALSLSVSRYRWLTRVRMC